MYNTLVHYIPLWPKFVGWWRATEKFWSRREVCDGTRINDSGYHWPAYCLCYLGFRPVALEWAALMRVEEELRLLLFFVWSASSMAITRTRKSQVLSEIIPAFSCASFNRNRFGFLPLVTNWTVSQLPEPSHWISAGSASQSPARIFIKRIFSTLLPPLDRKIPGNCTPGF